MIAPAGPAFRVVLYEGKDSRPLDGARRFEVMRALLEKGNAVTVCRDGGQVSAAGAGTILVLGQFETAHARADVEAPVGAALAAGPSTSTDAGADAAAKAAPTQPPTRLPVLPEQTSAFHPQVSDVPQLHLREIAGLDTAAVVAEVESVRSATIGPAPGKWKPWFPVIDYGRCTNCMQCLSFCLFDVYGVSEQGKIQVQNENNCKTDCPACSRVCPEVAILFPKYRFGPVNGDEINPDDLRREAMKVDISALLGGDIYSALRDRSAKAKSRFSKERDEDRALKERQRCLEKLHQAMDIPAEVLASLPSVDQIQVKAQQAKARAEAALKMQAGET